MGRNFTNSISISKTATYRIRNDDDEGALDGAAAKILSRDTIRVSTVDSAWMSGATSTAANREFLQHRTEAGQEETRT